MGVTRLPPPSKALLWLVPLLAAAPAAALDLAVPQVEAGYVWDRGYTGIGVEIGVLDLFMAENTHPAISGNYLGGVNFTKGGAWISAHATEVSGCALSQDPIYQGVAPGAAWWTGQTTKRSSMTTVRTQTIAAETFGQGLGSLNGNPVEVITLSIGLAGDTAAMDQWSLALDHIVHTNGRTVTVAAGNAGPGAGTLDGYPAGTFNAIIVGATGGTGSNPSEDYSHLASYSSRGPTSDGRAKPDIVAPGSVIHMPTLGGGWTDASGTSFATPLVAGGAALLIGMGQELGYSTDPKVIKSVLLNSADKLAGWNNTPTRPLDYNQGAGQMNLHSAYRQYRFGQRDPGAVPGIGWSGRELAAGAEDLYSLDLNLPAGARIAATLAWDRVVTTDTEDVEQVIYSFDHLDDLNLYLYEAGDLSTPMASSVSTVDNVEHVYFSIPAAGRYVVGVEMAEGGPGDAETYGLAWRVFPDAGSALPGDANLDGRADGADYTLWADNFQTADKTWFEGDFNGDGYVDGADYTLWSDNYTPAHGAGAAVPEPATVSVLALGGIAVIRRRRASARLQKTAQPSCGNWPCQNPLHRLG